jgi:hypothetical protein
MDEFTLCLITCVAAAAILSLSGIVPAPFALTLFVVSQAGYFSLLQITKGGIKQPWPAALLVLATFACFFVAGFFFGAINLLSSLVYLPLMFCLPAIVVAAREIFLSG